MVKVNKAPDHKEINLKTSALLEAFPFYVMLIDEDHHILMANSAVQSSLGLKSEDILGQYCPLVVHGLNHPIDNCPLEEAVITKQAVEREINDPSSGHWIRSAVYPIGGSTANGKRIFFHMITDITDRKQAEAQVKTSSEQLRKLAQHLESIREEEKTKLAREIHDDLGQLLTAMKMDVSWLAKRLPKTEVLLAEKANTVNGLIDDAMQTVQRVSSELRPGILDHVGLEAAIEWQLQELRKRTEIKFEFKPGNKKIRLDQDRATTIFRIFQEALTNVIRHANASKVKITLDEQPDSIRLKISDNGNGITAMQLSDPMAFGLISMRERAYSWGGDIKINSQPGKGTTVSVNIPLITKPLNPKINIK
jgi:PAS domain S-box-containing protein